MRTKQTNRPVPNFSGKKVWLWARRVSDSDKSSYVNDMVKQMAIAGWARVSPTLAGLHCKDACLHLSVRQLVCLQPYTINVKLTLSILWSFERPCVLRLSRWRLQPECSVGDLKQRRLKLKHAWQLTCGLYSYGPQTFNSRLFTTV